MPYDQPPRALCIPNAPSHDMRAQAVPEGKNSDSVTSIDKALTLLYALRNIEPAGVSILARHVGLHKSTVHRLLAVLQRHRLVERIEDRYRLGSGLYELGHSVYEAEFSGLHELLVPFLANLYEVTHETVHLAVLRGSEVVYLEKLYGHRKVPSPSKVGARMPAYCTAVGKVLLSYDVEATGQALTQGLTARTEKTICNESGFLNELAQIRTRGIAFDVEETAVGLTCVAVPIFSNPGKAVAAISVSGARGHFDPIAHAHMLRSVASAATKLVRGAFGPEPR